MTLTINTKLFTTSEIKVQRTLNPKWVNIFAHMVCVVVLLLVPATLENL